MSDQPKHTSSWHSPHWYKNHPEAQQPVRLPPTSVPSSKAMWIPRTLGLSIFAGFGIMRLYFWLGVSVVYIGLAVLLWEICVEPELIKRSAWLHVVGIGVVCGLFDWFTIGIVAARAPVTFYSYAMRKGDYGAATVIGGITWDSHFTDLRVWITNPSADDYQDLDLAVQPNKWSYKAAMLNGPSGCDLSAVDGNTIFRTRIKESGSLTATMTHVGPGFDAHDSMGNVYTPLATESGYRLRCGKFPGRFTIRIVFALIAVRPDLITIRSGAPGTWGMELSEIAGAKSDFDVLDARPSPSAVIAKGSYTRKLKPYSISNTITVKDGN